MPKLTKRVVHALKPGASDVVHWDKALSGLGVRVRPTGRKSHVVKCSVVVAGSRWRANCLLARWVPAEAMAR